MLTRGSGATSRQVRHRSVCSPIYSPLRLTPMWERGNWRHRATEIEAQTIRWIAELIGYPTDCGGLMVSGGNMAHFVCFLAARRVKVDWDIRQFGLAGAGSRRLRIYASTATHTWIQ